MTVPVVLYKDTLCEPLDVLDSSELGICFIEKKIFHSYASDDVNDEWKYNEILI